MKRALVILAAAALLGGCGNLVYSQGPLFSKADARTAPQFKPGLWLGEDDGCTVDETQPRDQWPDCGETWMMGPRGPADPKLWEEKVPLLAGGDPAILQIGFKPPADGDMHAYFALEVTARDKRGRATAFAVWPVLCGPPPMDEALGEPDRRRVTEKPLPGLEITENDCLVRDRDALFNAARASAAWTGEPMTARWVAER